MKWWSNMQSKIPMRICVVEPRSTGGMIHYAYQLCNALSDHVTEVTLVTAQNYELDSYPHKFRVHKLLNLWKRNDPSKVIQPRNKIQMILGTIHWNLRRVARGLRWYFEWIKLTNYLLKTRPDIVQFGEIEFPPESILLHFLKSRGLVLAEICHEFEPRETKTGFLWKIGNRLLRDAFKAFSVLFFHSKSNQVRFQELFPDIPHPRFHLIPMGNGLIFPAKANDPVTTDLMRERYGIKGDELVVLFFGNITPSKGVPDLIRAFAEVYAQNKQARLVIAGMPLKYIDVNSLIDMTSRLGIQSVTHFDTRYLPMEEVQPLMDLATVVVYPYINSTQSASIQAAYACGKAVIATRVGGLPDLIEDGASGLLVEPNCPEELGAAILQIINNPELAKKMGLRARELSETIYSWEPIAGNIANIYGDLLNAKKQDRGQP
jgi:glycosyltransferase involved in cell wall biosynthesis